MATEAVKITYIEAAAPSTPAAGRSVVYAKADGLMYSKDDAGVETLMSSGAGGSVATDAIWDAAGDVAVGTGANTAARLAIGNAGARLSRINGAAAWDANTSFPTLATGDRFWRSDLNQEFFYNGTHKLSTTLYRLHLAGLHISATANVSATTSPYDRAGSPFLMGGSDIWIETFICSFFIAGGGSALSGSHKWDIAFGKRVDAATTLTNITTVSIAAGSSSVFRRSTATVDALLNNGTVHDLFEVTATKTGTPGNFEGYHEVTFRVVAT